MVREASKIKAIAITGSSGKTSLKELLSQCLNKIASTSYSKKSFNNKFGVPLSLFNLNPKDDFGVFEVGMDKKGEIDNLTKIMKPDVGVITNVSYAHAKNFKNLKNIFIGDEYYFVDQNIKLEPIHDFYLMTLCKHFIVSSSTFCWWSAWLSKNENKICISPPNNMSMSSNRDIIPDDWISI